MKEIPDQTLRLDFRTPVLPAFDVFSGMISHKFLGNSMAEEAFRLMIMRIFSVIEQPSSLISVATLNQIAFTLPKVPLLSQHAEINEEIFCNGTHKRPAECYTSGICFCPHRLMVETNSVIEILLVNPDDRKKSKCC